MNPLDYTEPDPEDGGVAFTIKALAVFFGLIFVWSVTTTYSVFTYMLLESDAAWDLTIILVLLTIVALPFAAILMLLKKKSGWIIGAFYLASQVSKFLITMFFWATGGYYQSIFITVAALILFSIAGWVIAKPGLREIYRVNNHEMAISFICGATTSILLTMAISL